MDTSFFLIVNHLMILWVVVQTAKDVEDQTFKESPPTQSIEEDQIVNGNAPTQSTKLYPVSSAKSNTRGR